MTVPSAHGEEPIDRWLGDRHRDLRAGLARSLDPQAGLREVELLTEHFALMDGLGRRLNSEVGLAAIMQASSHSPKLDPRTPDLAAVIADPALRIKLRRDYTVLAAVFSDLNVQALVIADHFSRHDRENGDLIRDLISDLGRTRALNTQFNAEFDSALKIALAIERDSATRDLDLTRGIDRARFLGLENAIAFARDWARGYARGSNGPVQDDADDLNLGHARKIADREAVAAGRLFGVERAEGLTELLLDGTLDDFTDADLSHADFAGLDLTGVKWSLSGTRWPPGTDLEVIRAQSREAAPSTGIYVIVSPGDDGKDRQLVFA